MIIPDKKKTVSVILSRMNQDGKDGPQMDAKNESSDDPLQGVSEDILMAIKEGSAADLTTALKAFMAGSDTDDQGE